MKIKLFSGIPENVERLVNSWLATPGHRIIKISESSAMYVNPSSGDGEHAVIVMIEYEPLP